MVTAVKYFSLLTLLLCSWCLKVQLCHLFDLLTLAPIWSLSTRSKWGFGLLQWAVPCAVVLPRLLEVWSWRRWGPLGLSTATIQCQGGGEAAVHAVRLYMPDIGKAVLELHFRNAFNSICRDKMLMLFWSMHLPSEWHHKHTLLWGWPSIDTSNTACENGD